jgi:hypothetical protein
MAVFKDLGLIITTDFVNSGMRVHNLTAPGFPFLRTLGTQGNGATLGATAEFDAGFWMTPAPWSNSRLLVPDPNLARVVEVDVVTGLLVKVWFTGMPRVTGVAATGSRIVVTYGFDTASTFMKVYDLAGVLLWSVGGAALSYPDTSNVGVRLGAPAGVRFSQDGSYVIVAEGNSNRVTKWSTATGAYIGSVGSGYSKPYGVTECWIGAGVGALVAEYHGARVAVVSETGAVSTVGTGGGAATAVVAVPGLGVLVATEVPFYVTLYSSVAIATHPASATAVTPSTATFTVALTANSATTGLTYAWTKAGVPVGTSSPSYTYTATAADVDAGPTYAIVCTITHATGYAVTNAATLTVVRGVTISPLAPNAPVGGPGVTFTATPVAGNTVSVYAWTLGGVAVGTNAATYTYTAQESQAGQILDIVCTVTATYGTTTSNAVTVTVQVRKLCKCSWSPCTLLSPTPIPRRLHCPFINRLSPCPLLHHALLFVVSAPRTSMPAWAPVVRHALHTRLRQPWEPKHASQPALSSAS